MSSIPRHSYEVALPSGRMLHFGARTLIMGVLNVTPDSFSDGGRFADAASAIDAAARMVEEGADVIDIGGESTRPGAQPVDAAEERARVLPVIRALAPRLKVPLSIDTHKSEVARAALAEGAEIVNDISGLTYDPALARVTAKGGAALILMHTRGRFTDMYKDAIYSSVVEEVATELKDSIATAVDGGVPRERLILDPGLGFGKRAEHSLDLLSRLDAAPLRALDRPMLLGPSRKSFLGSLIGETAPADRDWATAAAVTAGIFLGVHMVRVHRVREMMHVVRVADAVRNQRAGA